MTVRIFEDGDRLNYDFSYNEREKEELHNELNNKSSITIDDLRRISLWKMNRVLSVGEDTLKLLSDIAEEENLTIESDLSRKTIDSLVRAQGIGLPLASTILKFIRPDVFPIIDVRAYRALKGRKPKQSDYKEVNTYINYTKDLLKISIKQQISLNKVDEQLYSLDKKHNGKI